PDPDPEPDPEPAPDGQAPGTPGSGGASGPATGGEQPAPVPVPVAGLRFDGVDDVLVAGPDPTAGLTGTARTVEAWIRPEGDGARAIMGVWQHGSGGFYARVSATGVLSAAVEDGAAWYEAQGSTPLGDGRWHHVAVVWRPGVAIDLYVDGVREPTRTEGTVAQAPAAYGANGARIVVGASGEHPSCGPTWWCDRFTGDMDDVRYSLGARYDGASFTPPATLTPDADTIARWSLDALPPVAEGAQAPATEARGEPGTVTGTR
ncbi:MAG TPA: LamG domain-containing protein, partial [Miltoncostaeaceae bacterium]|nr:LamG domain-containing protein [Miltoncostaeaceae bacterium]